MALFKIKKVNALPAEFEANTMYAVADGAAALKVFISSDDALSVRNIPTSDEMMSSVILFSETAPALTVPQLFWWDTTVGCMYVKYNDGTRQQWIEGAPAIPFPAFGGNGTAETMSRSDHWHDTIRVESPEW